MAEIAVSQRGEPIVDDLLRLVGDASGDNVKKIVLIADAGEPVRLIVERHVAVPAGLPSVDRYELTRKD